MRGARMRQIGERAKRVTEDMNEGLVIVQGGGNGLLQVGVDETVKQMKECVEVVKKKRVRVAIVGIIHRPSETDEYERARMEVNRRVCEGVLKMKMRDLKNDREIRSCSFLSMDHVINLNMFRQDGVHLNEDGTQAMSRRMCEWVKSSNN